MIKKFIARYSQKLVTKLYYSGVFKILEQKPKDNTEGINIKIERDCSIDPSAILITTGKGKIELEGSNYIGRNVELGTGEYIFIGANSSIQDRCILLGDIEIGGFCVFAPNIYASSGRHYFDLKPEFYIQDQDALVRNNAELLNRHSRKITIEDDCWIGINTVIMPGLTIGKGSIIGANSVVTENIEPYSVMAGSPAKLIKKRLNFTPKESIQFSNSADLPYFYSGFYTDQKSLEEHRKDGGIKIKKKFSVYLASKGKESITLEIKKNTEKTFYLKYGRQEKEIIASEFRPITFLINKSDLHQFELIFNEENKFIENLIFIKSASTK